MSNENQGTADNKEATGNVTLTPPVSEKTTTQVVGGKAVTKVVTQSPGVVVTQATAAPVETSVAVAKAMEVASAQGQMALYQVIDYCLKMKPGVPQTPESTESHQKNLMSSLHVLLSTAPEHFTVVYTALLSIVRDNKQGAFLPQHRNRGLNTVSIASIDNRRMRWFTRMLDCLCVTAGTVLLADVKSHVDFKALLDSLPTVAIRQNVTQYYSV